MTAWNWHNPAIIPDYTYGMNAAERKNLQTRSFRVGGMTCLNCQDRIEKKLKSTAGVLGAAVDYNTGAVNISYDATIIGFDEILAAIESLGYQTPEKNENLASQGRAAFQSRNALKITGTLVIILALFMLMRAFGTSGLAAAFPLAKEGMGYGMLLIIGLLTSVHCIAMCGGINLSQTLRRNEGTAPEAAAFKTGIPHSQLMRPYSLLLPSMLYNGGRLLSYTAAGVLVGALGSVLTVSGRFQGAVQLAAGVFMVIMGINMLGLFPALRSFSPRMPKIFAGKIEKRKAGQGPLVVGFLNGFMPCGPLQAMQLYALSTGSPVRGGVSMFLFCIGTIPLMFALGAVSSALSGAKGRVFSRRVTQTGAILVAALGLVMFSNGWSLSGFPGLFNRAAPVKLVLSQAGGEAFVPAAEDSVQIVNSTLLPRRYPAITVRQGIPVRWIINAPPGSINGCNNRMIINEYGIEYAFKQGDNIIEFTPDKNGRFQYSCWMGMINSTITVLAEGQSAADPGESGTALNTAGIIN
jgi:sulfite exporter TauE/SafE/copper chaperone CopZ